VVYTGAGISTSAEIPDFRGPEGVWTTKDKGKKPKAFKSILDIRPTFAHYAITELARRGMVKFVVTTNFDGLHWRSGLPVHLLEELHGSCFSLCCQQCQKFSRRPYEVIGSETHRTGELCEWCGNELLETGVAFGEGYRSDLEPIITQYHAERADLAIVVGTSMCVQSAAMYPLQVVGKGNLVLVNAQNTPVDDLVNVRLYGKTDLFFGLLMQELGIGEFDRKTDVRVELAAKRTRKGRHYK
jgi:NAD-dependent SIR2 family protein deacetylase